MANWELFEGGYCWVTGKHDKSIALAGYVEKVYENETCYVSFKDGDEEVKTGFSTWTGSELNLDPEHPDRVSSKENAKYALSIRKYTSFDMEKQFIQNEEAALKARSDELKAEEEAAKATKEAEAIEEAETEETPLASKKKSKKTKGSIK